MKHGRPNLERGDKVEQLCGNCGERYMHKNRVDQDPPRSTRFCPECYQIHEKVSDAIVAGKWRINDEAVREQLLEAIITETDYAVWVAERVGDVYVYDTEQVA